MTFISSNAFAESDADILEKYIFMNTIEFAQCSAVIDYILSAKINLKIIPTPCNNANLTNKKYIQPFITKMQNSEKYLSQMMMESPTLQRNLDRLNEQSSLARERFKMLISQ